MSKTIKERAAEYNAELYGEDDPIEFNEVYYAFCDGAESEHEELTRWNSSSDYPESFKTVLLKVKIDCAMFFIVGFFNGAYYLRDYDRKPLTNVLCWREIHE